MLVKPSSTLDSVLTLERSLVWPARVASSRELVEGEDPRVSRFKYIDIAAFAQCHWAGGVYDYGLFASMVIRVDLKMDSSMIDMVD
jgi:hypothetical protein